MDCCNHNDSVERVSSQFVTVFDSIFSTNIQNMIYTGKYLVWNSIRETPILHIIDPNIGKEIVSLGSIGNGPHEFISPMLKKYNRDTIYVCDPNTLKQRLIPIHSNFNDSMFVSMPDLTINSIVENKLFIDNKSFITYSLDIDKSPFKYVSDRESFSFGKHPLNLEYKITPSLVSYLTYNYDKEVLVCFFTYFPYMAIYQKKDNSFELVNEISQQVDYSVENDYVTFHSDCLGAVDVALTKDYIVSVEYDYNNGDDVVLNGNPDDFKYPHCLFVRDYKGTLLKIVDFDFQIKSISGDCENNDIYCLVQNPEYQIIKTVVE